MITLLSAIAGKLQMLIRPAFEAYGPRRSIVLIFGGKRFIRTVVPVFAYAVFLTVLVLVNPLTTVSENKALVKVNGAELTENDLMEAINEVFPMAGFHGGLTLEKVEKYKPKGMTLMIENELFFQEARARGMELEKGRLKKIIDEKISRMGGRSAFKKSLESWGLTEKDYEGRLLKKLLVADFIKAAIDEKAVVTDEEVRVHYERNKEGYMRPEAFRLRHILISVKPNALAGERREKRKRAQEVVDKLDAGEDMAKLAWVYSDDPYRVKGGDLGLVHKGMLDPDLEGEVLKLKVGEHSGVLETIYGYHIAKIEQRLEPTQLSLEDIYERVSSKFREEKKKTLKETLIGRLKAEAEIEVY